MQDIAYYNGRYAPIAEMQIPMNDRACFLGDGIYDATAVLNHVPLDLEEHIERFFNSARAIDIRIPMSRSELAALLRDMANKVDSGCQFLYMQVTRGVGPRNHLYRFAGDKPSLWAFSRPFEMADVMREYKAITVEDIRFQMCHIKTIDLLPSVLAAQKAEEAGCDEAIFHRNGRVTECAHSNVHILRGGTLITAPLDHLILPGVARKHILAICRHSGIPVEERPFDLSELVDADEIFFSNAGALTCRITEIDGERVGGRDPETFGVIRDLYQQEIRRQAGLA